MNKMLVAVFDSEVVAAEGFSALKGLHNDGDITVYATAVLVKDASGKVSIKQAADQGPIGTGLGMLAGSMVGLLAGPVGLAVGASMGTLTGLIFDLNKSGIDVQFVDDVSKALSSGKAAVLADVEESWAVPVDTRVGKLGGMVFRRLRSEVVEDQLVRESAAFQAEVKQLKEEMAQARAENKAAIQAQIDEAKKKAQVMQDQAKARIDQTKREAEAKITALQGQLKHASDRQKAKIEKRIAEVKADLEARHAKLQQAGRLAKEALTL
ncbi:DUF1269 domain-containing protein [candidate division KSB1 bacterium]|nr:DUF1269 domain-containing protein [bacterium]NUM67498.1 DUF1269 domain-containing protein [candidate division KSB1 bacterium]